MTKQFSSKFSTDQLIQLSKQILNSADVRHVDALMRAHVTGSTRDWNRQELIAFIAARNGGTLPDQVVENMAAASARKQQATQNQPQDGGGLAVRIIDLSEASKPAPANPRAAVFVDCVICRKEIAVPESKSHEPVFCSQGCKDRAAAKTNAATRALETFVTEVPQFYICDYNENLLLNYLKGRGVTELTSEVLLDAYLNLRGQLLHRLTPDAIRDMTPEEFDKRSKQEPGDIMGGVDLNTMKVQKGEPSIHSSNKVKTYDLPPQGYAGGVF